MAPPHEDRREQALAFLATQGVRGGTWKELAEHLGIHHGSASSVLSLLHKNGRISCLAEDRRDRSHVYVLPDLVGGRPTRARGRGPGKTPDENWQQGYDAAMAQTQVGEPPNLDAVREMAYLDGIGRGRIQEAAEVMRIVAEMRRAIKGQHRVYTHTRSCWLDHPDCALQSIEKVLLKTLPPPRREPTHADIIAV
jgi:hypothetical protein